MMGERGKHKRVLQRFFHVVANLGLQHLRGFGVTHHDATVITS